MAKEFKFNSLIIVLLILLSGCEQNVKDKSFDEGKIIYKIEFPKEENNSVFVDLLPDKMELSFKKNNTKMDISDFTGFFHISYLTDYENHTNYSLLQVLHKKLINKTDSSDITFGYKKIKNNRIEYLPDTMTICDFTCHKAIAHCKDIDRDLELWYTNDIDIKKSNMGNPFRDLDGVLMKFQVILSGIYMEFNAEKIMKEEIPDETFDIPSGFKEVDKSEIENLIKSFDPNLE